MPKPVLYGSAVGMLIALAAAAQPTGCNTPATSSSVTIALPSHPFGVVPTKDGCWVFVSLMGDDNGNNPGIAVLKRGGGKLELAGVVPLKSRPTGMALTHDGKLLIAAALDAVVFLDVQRMIAGTAGAILGSFSDGPNASSIYANVTPDDKLLFVSEERAHAITVIDLDRARANGYQPSSIIGQISVGRAPIALTFSPDGKWLYTTSQVAMPDWKWPKACTAEGNGKSEITNPEGAVIVIDVERAKTAPAQSVAARIPAACSPVRMAISPRADFIYVTARNNNAVLAFDTAKLVSDPGHARLGMAPVGSAPVPIVVIADGTKVIVGNSNRFAGTSAPQSLTVLDATSIRKGAEAELGTIPAGAFPRELTVSSDGRTLFLTNFGSSTLQVMDLEHLPIAPHQGR